MKWIRLIDEPPMLKMYYPNLDIELHKFSRWDCEIECKDGDIKQLDNLGIKWEAVTPTK